MNYAEWEQQVPDAIRQEALWDFLAYRKALFLYDICWMDCEKLLQHPLGQPVARQLIRSAGSISANIEEGTGEDSAGIAIISCAPPSVLPARAKAGTIGPRHC